MCNIILERIVLVIYWCFQIFSHRPPLWNQARIYWSPRKWQNWLDFRQGVCQVYKSFFPFESNLLLASCGLCKFFRKFLRGELLGGFLGFLVSWFRENSRCNYFNQPKRRIRTSRSVNLEVSSQLDNVLQWEI